MCGGKIYQTKDNKWILVENFIKQKTVNGV